MVLRQKPPWSRTATGWGPGPWGILRSPTLSWSGPYSMVSTGQAACDEVAKSVAVSGDAPTEDRGHAHVGDHGDLSPWLTILHIRDVNLDGRDPDCLDRIPDGVRVVREGSGVDDDSVGVPSGMKAVDQVAFMIRLEGVDGCAKIGSPRPAGSIQLFDAGRTVDLGRTHADQVQVGSIDDDDPHSDSFGQGSARCKPEFIQSVGPARKSDCVDTSKRQRRHAGR